MRELAERPAPKGRGSSASFGLLALGSGVQEQHRPAPVPRPAPAHQHQRPFSPQRTRSTPRPEEKDWTAEATETTENREAPTLPKRSLSVTSVASTPQAAEEQGARYCPSPLRPLLALRVLCVKSRSFLCFQHHREPKSSSPRPGKTGPGTCSPGGAPTPSRAIHRYLMVRQSVQPMRRREMETGRD